MSTKKERQYKIYDAIDQYKLNRVFYLLRKQGVDKSVLIGIEEQAKALRNTLCAISNDLVDTLNANKVEEAENNSNRTVRECGCVRINRPDGGYSWDLCDDCSDCYSPF